MVALKSMSVAKLTNLKEKVEAAIAEKAKARRTELEMKLSELDRQRLQRKARKASGPRGARRGLVAPKYRNPKEPSETWSGRGKQPRWLTAALKTGRSIDEFVIKKDAKSSDLNRRRATVRSILGLRGTHNAWRKKDAARPDIAPRALRGAASIDSRNRQTLWRDRDDGWERSAEMRD